MRDDFSENTRRNIAARVAMRCSNPDCGRATSGPRTESDLTVSIGVAAHIHAASPGGCRYDPHMTSEQRSHETNGLWLCQTCAKLIDNDAQRFPVETLLEWKYLAEDAARQDLARRSPHSGASSGERPAVPSNLHPVVKIELNPDHSLRTAESDFEKILTRVGVAAVAGKRLPIEVSHVGLREYLDGVLDDPIAKESYVVAWAARAQRISKALERMFSSSIREGWGLWLSGVPELSTAAREIFRIVGAGGIEGGTKIDVWRTDAPEIFAPIRLSDEELDRVLTGFGFQSRHDLAFGAGWRAADELPRSIIVGRVIPQILLALDRHGLPLDLDASDVLILGSWHIGLG